MRSDHLGPAGGGVDVHLDHARVGRDGEMQQPRVGRRQVAFQDHLAADLGRRASTAAIRSSQSSAANSGGKKMCSMPSRDSTASAVRTTPGSASPTTGHRLRLRAEILDRAAASPRGRRAGQASGSCCARRHAAPQRGMRRQVVAPARRDRPRVCAPRILRRSIQGRRVERQAQPDRAVAGDQEQVLAAEEPAAGLPAPHAVLHHAAHRQHRRRPRRASPWPKTRREALALQRVRELRVLDHHVGRQALFRHR